MITRKELLHLFGIPYVVSPGEAEAQCAALESLNLVDGIITDDSDVWRMKLNSLSDFTVFGGNHVIRNIFQKDKYVESYNMKDIKSEVGLDRDNLIKLALLLGSDYTEGVLHIFIISYSR
jgi:DNA excision repair protein ERCC-5